MAKKLICTLLSIIMILSAIPTVFAAGTWTSAAKSNVTIDRIVEEASEIIRLNESRGRYDVVNPDDNGALSIGWVQWHANRALNLLKTIVSANPSQALGILGQTLYNEIVSSTSWTTRILNSDETSKISALISTNEGKIAQDALAANDITSYINHAMALGVTDPSALVYHADVENQCGQAGARRVLEAAIKLAGSAAAVTVDHVHSAALADASAGKYANRRNTTYNFCLLLEWAITGTKYEVWNIITARNARQTPDTNSPLNTTIPADSKVIISEKAYFDGLTRGKTKMGWITLDFNSCSINTELTGGYVGAPINFNTNSANESSTPTSQATVTKYNAGRGANDLSVFDGGYAYSNAQTNAYGAECTVDKSGLVLSAPTYGVYGSKIPSGGFVLSAHGTMQSWIISNVKKGDYVYFDKATNTLRVFKSETAYLLATAKTTMNQKTGILPTPSKAGFVFSGWTDDKGATVTADTLCTSPLCITLNANWRAAQGSKITFVTNGGQLDGTVSTTVHGINTNRGADQLILFRGSATTGTNQHGNEAAIDKNGRVVAVYGFDKGNNPIPEGGYVLSGHTSMANWIHANLTVGAYVVFDEYEMTVTVYKDESTYHALNTPVTPGTPIGTLPTVTKEYHKFLGWYTPSGEKATASTVMTAQGLILTAKWEVLPGTLSFNTNGGEIPGKTAQYTNGGQNVHRGANVLAIYKNKSTTGTNDYGSEAIVGSDGIVDAVFPYGYGNNTIPSGSFVLSGHGNASSFIQSYVVPGAYVEITSSTVNVWRSYDAYLSAKNTKTTVKYGDKYGTLPTAEKEGCKFLGWKDANGNTVTSSSEVSVYGNVTLTAQWEKLCTVTFNTEGGKLVSGAVSATANGINTHRGANNLIIYAGKTSTSTNEYGTEAVISPEGKVTSVRYGGNTAIPAGCFVLSGHGTMSSWISSNLKVGKYVTIKGFSIKVYDSIEAYDAEDGVLYVESGKALNCYPNAEKGSDILAQWQSGGTVYSKSSVITSDVTLSPKWTKVSMALIFDTKGGTISPMKSTAVINGLNVPRGANVLNVFDSNYAYSNAQTNAYGAECAVDANGYVISTPVYGTYRTAIPKGGYVLSGHGTMCTWLTSNVKAGDYIHVDKTTMTVSVYNSYGDYLYKTGKTAYAGKAYGALPTPVKSGYVFAGWQDHYGNAVTENTIVTSCEVPVLTAIWKKQITITFDISGGSLHTSTTAITGTNVNRGANDLILYKNKSHTGTNLYGTEAIINAEGKVVSIYYCGTTGNNPIPSGCYALSGHGTMDRWISTNLKVGYYVELIGNNVYVYSSKASFDIRNKTVTLFEGDKIKDVPAPTKYGYTFNGWWCNGILLDSETAISESCTFTAGWTAKNINVTFDANGGSFSYRATRTADGINVHRSANMLVIFDQSSSKTSTGTNTYGTEVIVSAEGIVTEIRPYGYGNAPIPEGGFVLSGHDAGALWLINNLSVGDAVSRNGAEIFVYDNTNQQLGNTGKTALFGSALGSLPTPTRSGYTFAGWYTSDGTSVTEATIISSEKTPLVLVAKWK